MRIVSTEYDRFRRNIPADSRNHAESTGVGAGQGSIWRLLSECAVQSLDEEVLAPGRRRTSGSRPRRWYTRGVIGKQTKKRRPPTIEELAAQQGVKPVRRLEDIRGPGAPDRAAVDDFLKLLRSWRRGDGADRKKER